MKIPSIRCHRAELLEFKGGHAELVIPVSEDSDEVLMFDATQEEIDYIKWRDAQPKTIPLTELNKLFT